MRMRTTEHVGFMATVFGLLRPTESLSELTNQWMMVESIQVRPREILSKLTLRFEEGKGWITVFQCTKGLSDRWKVVLLKDLDQLINMFGTLMIRERLDMFTECVHYP
jgi:hypothetical protein